MRTEHSGARRRCRDRKPSPKSTRTRAVLGWGLTVNKQRCPLCGDELPSEGPYLCLPCYQLIRYLAGKERAA